MVHYGGDGGRSRNYRQGTLYFYNNTLISYRTDRTTLFRLSTNSERCDARNNIFYAAPATGNTVSLLDTNGVLSLSHNWIKPGFVTSFGKFRGIVNNDGTMITGGSPGFINEGALDFHLQASSACVDAGGGLNPAVLPAQDLLRQYVKHQSSEARTFDGAIDIGAFELP